MVFGGAVCLMAAMDVSLFAHLKCRFNISEASAYDKELLPLPIRSKCQDYCSTALQIFCFRFRISYSFHINLELLFLHIGSAISKISIT